MNKREIGCGKEIEISYGGLYLPSYICGHYDSRGILHLCKKCRKDKLNAQRGNDETSS